MPSMEEARERIRRKREFVSTHGAHALTQRDWDRTFQIDHGILAEDQETAELLARAEQEIGSIRPAVVMGGKELPHRTTFVRKP